MRLQNYITETKEEVTELSEMIEKDCREFLNKTRGNVLYRGVKLLNIKLDSKKYAVLKPRSERRPTDTPKDVQEYVDTKLKKRFGWRPRTEGIFVTGSYSQAKDYGSVATVWPIGHFKYIWSKDITDFYTDVYKRYQSLGPKRTLDFDGLDKAIESYQDSNLINAIRANKEIMLKTKEYYVVPLHTYAQMKNFSVLPQ